MALTKVGLLPPIPLFDRGPNSAAVCRLKETIAKRAGVDRQRRRRIDGQCHEHLECLERRSCFVQSRCSAVRTLEHTIARTDIHRRRRCGIEHDRKHR